MNKELIEQLRDDEIHVFDAHEAADALELADKRIAELEVTLGERHEDYRRERDRLNDENSAVLKCLKEAERKLAVAREALNSIAKNTCCGDCQEAKKVAQKSLAQIGGEDAGT